MKTPNLIILGVIALGVVFLLTSKEETSNAVGDGKRGKYKGKKVKF